MFVKYGILAFFAFGGGLTVSGGVFTALLAVGLLPRFADKTHTAGSILLYEEMVVIGTILGGLMSVYKKNAMLGHYMITQIGMEPTIWHTIGRFLLAVSGIFYGIFVGCLALAIAEMLDTIPIFNRRIHIQKGLGIILCFVAVGKMIGSLLYFAYGLFGN